MTKPNFTSINIVLDRSGSMKNLAKDTIGGFNTFLADQKKVEGEAVLTLAAFSSEYVLLNDFSPLKDAKDLTIDTYRPAGYTALLDAVGRTINTTGARLAAMAEDERPSQVIFVIVTDGEENFSKEFTRDKIFEMISHQRDKYNWEFVFLGANQDAIQAGTRLGVTASNSFNYVADVAGTNQIFSSISSNTTTYRNSGAQQVNFFDQGTIVTPATTVIVTDADMSNGSVVNSTPTK